MENNEILMPKLQEHTVCIGRKERHRIYTDISKDKVDKEFSKWYNKTNTYQIYSFIQLLKSNYPNNIVLTEKQHKEFINDINHYKL